MTRFLNSMPALFVAGLLLGLVALGGCATVDPDLAGAREQLRQGDYDQAIALTDRALETDPTNADVYVLRGEIFGHMAERAEPGPQRSDHIRSMVDAYSRARELDPTNQLIEVILLQAYAQQMNVGAHAWEEGRQDPSRYHDAARSFQDAAVIMPDSANAVLFQGLALLAAGETDRAAAPLEHAIELGVEAEEAYQYLSQIYLTQDRADEAVVLLEAGVARFPDSVDLRSELLNAYARTGQIERAIDAYGDIVDESPDDAILRYNYGSFLLQAERYEEAAEHLRRATELDPTIGDAHYNLGASYLNRAIEIHEMLVEMDVGTQAADDAQAERDALLRQSLGPLERARQLFEEEHNIQDACRGLFRAYALLLMNQEAIEAAECAGIDLD